ncbi:MAG: helix-hairpin-helix domain-containing protein [Dehalococcoidia bacterium]|nr:helix-hairpin-helix domain-containing protein [Dehalococcoidia bacterium]
MVNNAETASIFRELADLLLEKKENWFKIHAYRKVADEIEKQPVELTTLAGEGKLRTIPGVGEAIEKKIKEILATGTLGHVERLKAELEEVQVEQPRK